MRVYAAIFISCLYLTSCNFHANSPSSKLSINIDVEETPEMIHGLLPDQPTVTDFWRGAVIVDGPDFTPFQFNLAVEDQRVVPQTIEFDVLPGSDRKLAVILIADGTSSFSSTPFELTNSSSRVFYYSEIKSFNATDPQVDVNVVLRPTVYTQSSNITDTIGNKDLVNIFIFNSNSSAFFTDRVISFIDKTTDLPTGMSIYAAATSTKTASYIALRLPADHRFDIFSSPTSGNGFASKLFENLIINIPPGLTLPPTSRRLIDNLSPTRPLGEVFYDDTDLPRALEALHIAQSASGKFLFINPSPSANPNWKTEDVDRDGFSLQEEMTGNSDPFDAASIPSSSTPSLSQLTWNTPTVIDDFVIGTTSEQRYKQVKVSFAENGQTYGRVGFIRGSNDPSAGIVDYSAYTVVAQHSAATNALSFEPASKEIPDRINDIAIRGDVLTFEMCVASSSLGIIAGRNQNTISSSVSDAIDVQTKALVSGVASAQVLVNSSPSTPTYIRDIRVGCTPNGLSGVVAFTYSPGFVSQLNSTPWGVALAHYNPSSKNFPTLIADDQKLIIVSDISTNQNAMRTLPFGLSFLDSTTGILGMGILTSGSMSTLRAALTQATTTTTTAHSTLTQNATGVEQVHVIPLLTREPDSTTASTLINATAQGVLYAYVRVMVSGRKQLTLRTFTGQTFGAPEKVGSEFSHVDILDVDSFVHPVTQTPGTNAVILYRTSDDGAIFTYHAIITRFKSDGTFDITDNMVGKNTGSNDLSYTKMRVAFMNAPQAVMAYPKLVSQTLDQYKYFSAIIDGNNILGEKLIADITNTTNQSSDIHIDIDSVKNTTSRLLAVFTICTDNASCILKAATGAAQ